MSTITDLLTLELPKPQTRQLKIPRLKLADGSPLTLTLRQLTYSRVADLKRMNDNIEIQTVLAGVTEPNLRDMQLCERFGAATPVELVAKMFLPGEIEEIAEHIERLSGYRRRMTQLVEEVQKN